MGNESAVIYLVKQITVCCHFKIGICLLGVSYFQRVKMDDFDVFTDEIKFTKPFYMDLLNKFVKDVPATPIGPNYECECDHCKGRCIYE